MQKLTITISGADATMAASLLVQAIVAGGGMSLTSAAVMQIGITAERARSVADGIAFAKMCHQDAGLETCDD